MAASFRYLGLCKIQAKI